MLFPKLLEAFTPITGPTDQHRRTPQTRRPAPLPLCPRLITSHCNPYRDGVFPPQGETWQVNDARRGSAIFNRTIFFRDVNGSALSGPIRELGEKPVDHPLLVGILDGGVGERLGFGFKYPYEQRKGSKREREQELCPPATYTPTVHQTRPTRLAT
ncbi:hypothetical protein LX36DRAFT_10607 [Colletotrichum falcatum]|nr:hypothetical protein LX36DRAFT_10607 [Colletotrichum falcatum]